jgi:hypothetical protein
MRDFLLLLRKPVIIEWHALEGFLSFSFSKTREGSASGLRGVVKTNRIYEVDVPDRVSCSPFFPEAAGQACSAGCSILSLPTGWLTGWDGKLCLYN